MDPDVGLEYIVQNEEFASKLASGLDTDNRTVKKQLFGLLSDLTSYSPPDGYQRVLDALQYYKVKLSRDNKHNWRRVHFISV
ncbi:hypothetical protein LSH36_2g03004 [Paralvinella palmiformis]|uniref:Uncharacterized protein n=1 Tax=Paralvinella palmiformis TaxID=53620 RepID=A0AAD9NHJ5_9ANNE|nr:hypothetical protein LSH36_2g03004 [Paralvinella palmiformis]